MTSVFAPPGAYIPGKDMTLGVGTIRGVESRGHAVSPASSSKLSDDHEGILDLPDDAPVGQPYAAYAGLDDPVIEINLTPNRPDCASVHGIARDLAAAGLGTLKTDAVPPLRGAGPCPVKVALDFEPGDEKLCPTFALRLVRGVQQRAVAGLDAAAACAPSACARSTRSSTSPTTSPSTAAARCTCSTPRKVRGNLTVRRARDGEEVLALDGRTYRLDRAIVVIADESGVESIAGIMGGEHTGCDEATTDVLIESALWDPLNIAQTGRKLGIVTDARYRFERGVDPAVLLAAASTSRPAW